MNQTESELLKTVKIAKDMLSAYDYYLSQHAQVKVPCSIIHSKITPALHILSKAIKKAETEQENPYRRM